MKNLENYGLSVGDNIVIKVGSNILTGNSENKEDVDFGINHKNVANIVNSIEYLMQLGLNVFLVSSGAVAIGKREFEKQGIDFGDKLTQDEKAFLSGNGQISLMNLYHKLFLEKNILISQNLLTHNSFKKEHIFNNLKNIWSKNIKYKTVAIINENDTISREELKFSDNDELAGLVAKGVNAKILFLLSDIDGIYKNFGKKDQELINEVSDVSSIRIHANKEKIEGSYGSGGMDSKLNVFESLNEAGIEGILANGGTKDIIKKIIEGENVAKTYFRI